MRARLLLVLVVLAGVALESRQAQAPRRDPQTIMSFNIRYGTANDGANRWANRRTLLFDVVRQADADLIGLQEALDAQIQEIGEAFPAYGVIGVGRDDGRTRGEYAAILFRRDRFHVAAAGTFWFSDTPDVVASKTWGNNITRICTWARLVDRSGQAFWMYNVHLDHESQPSRERSTALLAERIEARWATAEPVIITGDFNVGEDNVAIATLLGRQGARPPRYLDTFRVLHPDVKDAGTFTGFTLGNTSGPKIDYILIEPGTDVMEAAIVRTASDGRYASDHFPVTARVRLR